MNGARRWWRSQEGIGFPCKMGLAAAALRAKPWLRAFVAVFPSEAAAEPTAVGMGEMMNGQPIVLLLEWPRSNPVPGPMVPRG